jgi:transcriptional regulator
LGLDALKDVLRKTSLHFENNNAHSSAVFDNLPEEYTVRLVKAIVAFEIEVEEMDNVFKLSQNRDEESYHNIIGKLDESGHDGQFIADEMKKRQSQVFRKDKNP